MLNIIYRQQRKYTNINQNQSKQRYMKLEMVNYV
jgi:hypothetical protein